MRYSPSRPSEPLATLWTKVGSRATASPDRPAFTFLADGETPAGHLTYGDLDRRARAVAVALGETLATTPGAASAGDRAVLLLPPGLEFVTAFLGCLYAGVVPVPAYPPRPGRGEARVRSILADARPALGLAPGASLARLTRQLGEAAPAVRWVAVDEIPDAGAGRWRPPPDDPEGVAFLQYTSGSTASPRGVEVTHRNLAVNEDAIQEAFGQSEESVVVGWLPLYHDMGLVGNVLQPLWCGGSCVLMSPSAFLQRPRRWLEAVDRYRGTTSGGPDFGYLLAARKVPPEERRGLDLSSWRVAFDGAEPVRAATLDEFATAFAASGFRREAFLPCYGLAEATLFVSAGRREAPPQVLAAEARALERGRIAPVQGSGTGRSRALVSCGRPARGIEVTVVDPERRTPVEAHRVGEIWLRGGSVARGYFRRPAETAAAFGARIDRGPSAPAGDTDGPYLRTGDLGFLAPDGELFVTGRLKDLLIVRGRNLYPQDVERSAESAHPAIRPGGAAAFSVEEDGEERLVVACEVARRREREAGAVAAAVAAAVAREHEVAVAAAVPVAAGELPRTSSGKLRRGECRRRFLAAELPPLARPAARAAGEGAPDRAPDTAVAYLRDLAHRAGAPVATGDEAPLHLDSLQAVELRNRVLADRGVDLPLEYLLEGRSLAALAELLPAARAEVDDPMEPRQEAETERQWHRPTAGQEALLLLERLGEGGGAYAVAFAARLDRLDRAPPGPDALRRSLAALVARHPALRTVYARDGDRARVLPPGAEALDLRVVARRDLEPGAGGLRRYLSDEMARPFDLERGPVARFRYLVGDGPPVLLLAVHHVAIDLWSLEILLEDLARLLVGGEDGSERAALPPAVPFTAFAHWQESLLAGPSGSVLRRFWRRELAGAATVLDLPADRSRPPAPDPAGERLHLLLPPEAEERARALTAAAGSTLYVLLLAAFAALLSRLVGRDDLLVGSPAAGRSRAGLEGVVGYCANLLPVRADLSGAPTFRELVERLRARTARVLEHQDLPFPVVVEEVAPERDRSRHPLVQAGLAMERPHRLRQAGGAGFVLGREGARVELGTLCLTAVELERRAVQLELLLVAADAGGRLAVAFDYATALFDRTTVRRWARSFGILLAAAADDPRRRIAELPLLAAPERAQLLREWNDTAPRTPGAFQRTVHGLVAERTRSAPDAVAVEAAAADGRIAVLTYGGLRRRALRLARRLREAGAGPERAVAVTLERSPDLVVALLAVLESGSFYVPLDREHPPARVASMVAATRPAVVVTRPGVPGEAPGARTVVLGGGELRGETGWSGPPVPPEALAYVLFTSGSTGAPKGIAVPHRAVARLVARPEYVRIGPGAAILQLAPVPFDASTFEIWGFLAAGGRLVVTPPGPVAPGPLERTVARHRVDTLWLTTGLFHLVADDAPGAIRAVDRVLTGGDVLSPEHVRRTAATLHRAGGEVTACYGPTEGTTFTSSLPFRAPEEVPSPVPLGRPISGTRVLVADARLRLAPPGVPGELAIGGAGLARGYHGRPAATAERFVPDPFAGPDEPGARLYLTGDLARIASDGVLGFLGRLDTQVKVRGFRVELAEVETALLRAPGVREAVVIRRDDALAAYVVPAAEGATRPAAAALRERLARELPPFMVPATYTVVDALPLGATGKVDRARLPDPAGGRRAGGRPRGRRPRSELERTLTGLWAEALGIAEERVDPEVSFFDLGGHSLQMARLHRRLGEALGEEVAIVELFDHPTVASLSEWLERRAAADPEGAPPRGPAPEGGRAAARRAAMKRRRALRREVGSS